jgi:hypothetical protein
MLPGFFCNTTTYCFIQNKKLFILTISCSKGWGVSYCKTPLFLIKGSFLFFLSHRKSYSSFMSIIFLGFQKGYFQYLTLKGVGYKFICVISNIILKFGFSHRIMHVNPINTKFKCISRYLLRMETRCFWTLWKLAQAFNSLRKKNLYKKKGIFLKGCIIITRVSSKKAKF